MKSSIVMLALLGLAACATETAPPAEPEPVTLPDAEFKALWNAAYNSDPESGAETAFTAMLDRDDLTPAQRGEVYFGRGTMRGIFVRDWPEAFPQCALGDYMLAKDLPLTPARLQQVKEDMEYQISRQHYFPEAPALCKEWAAEAAVWLYGKKE